MTKTNRGLLYNDALKDLRNATAASWECTQHQCILSQCRILAHIRGLGAEEIIGWIDNHFLIHKCSVRDRASVLAWYTIVFFVTP